MATILWASAWADHVEEQQCQSVSGCEITDLLAENHFVIW
jgi:hypothetical protein